MLLPKRVKHRRVQRGRMTGKAMRGNKVSYGDFGLVALEPEWVPVKVLPSIGLPLLSPAESCLRSPALIRSSQKRLCVLLLTSSPSSANL